MTPGEPPLRIDLIDVLGADPHQFAFFAPQLACIYRWDLSLTRLTRQGESLGAQLGRASRRDRANLEPYASVEVHARPMAMRPAVSAKSADLSLDSILQAAALIERWQRPLYVGRTLSLRARLAAHMRYGSTLRERLTDHDIQMEDCSVTYWPAPKEIQAEGLHIQETEEEEEEAAIPVNQHLHSWLVYTEAMAMRFSQPYFNVRNE